MEDSVRDWCGERVKVPIESRKGWEGKNNEVVMMVLAILLNACNVHKVRLGFVRNENRLKIILNDKTVL